MTNGDPFLANQTPVGQPAPQPSGEQQNQPSPQQATPQGQVQQPAQAQPQTPPQPDVSQQIQQLLQQQQTYQAQYSQIVSFLQSNTQISPEQITQYKAQIQQLNVLYQQNQQRLSALGYNPVQVNKPTTVKSGASSSFSFKKLFIGCAVLLILLVGGFGVGLYALLSNPTQLASMGITPAVAKNLLQIFTAIFFGVFMLGGFALLLVNAYRLFTVKNKSKLGYIVGLIFGILVLGIFGAGAGIIFGKISDISVELIENPNLIVRPSLVLKGDTKQIYDGSQPLIAPSQFSFELMQAAFNNFTMKTLGQAEVRNVRVVCGNSVNQKVFYSAGTFQGYCFYEKKGNYDVSVEVEYRDLQTQEIKTLTQKIGTLPFISEVKISTLDSKGKATSLPTANGEIQAGKAPAKVEFDATDIFKDFGLQTYEIIWDIDGDDQIDKSDVTSFNHIYKQAKVYYPTVKIPSLGEYMYTFPLRVEQSNVPICDISISPIKLNQYAIQTSFWDSAEKNVSSYKYTILDQKTNKAVNSFDENNLNFNYTFPGVGSYIVKLDFITDDGKKGRCESSLVQIGESKFDVIYDVYKKGPSDTVYQKVDPKSFTGNSITIKEVPTMIKVNITKVTPDNKDVETNVFVNNKALLSKDNNREYEFQIADTTNYSVVVSAKDETRDVKTDFPFSVKVDKEDIVGKLKVTPSAVGFEPLKVSLDASSTTIADPDDEIIYFTWDFGDGEIKKNIPNGVITHTYVYDHAKENGEYRPKVTITTKKGRQIEIPSEETIMVRKQLINVHLSSPSHPAQVAKIGDTIQFMIEFNGLPEKIYWDFGDGSAVTECKGRTCTEVNKIYVDPGTYTVMVTMDFEDAQSVSTTMDIRVS